jgi:RNA polymerase sigma-70 factor (ECF subfamily)
VLTRFALNRRRGVREVASELDWPQMASSAPDPEIDLLQGQHRQLFREALEAAVASLSAEDRNVLRLYYLDGLTVEEIARLFQLHKSSVSRRIAKVREAILDETRERLKKQLGVRSSELSGLMGAALSQVDVSLSRFLKAVPKASAHR